jgi:hypothetical protein
MIWLVESALIGVTFLVFVVLVCVWQDRAPVERRADPEPPPGEPGYGPFPVDTGPLLILGEHAAALAAHEREVAAMIREAERTMLWR